MANVKLTIQIDAQGNVTAIDQAGNSLGKAEKQAATLEQRLERVRQAQDRLSNTLLIGGGAVLALGYKGVQAASDLSEAQNKVDVIYGKSADVINKWAETSARAMGLSERAAKDAAATYGNFFQNMGVGGDKAAEMSTSLVQVGADLASFHNLVGGPEEGLLKLQAGLAGEIEPLRRLGISFSAVDVENKALEMGLARTKKEISEGAKVQARYALIMEQTKSVQGDFARTADGLANKQRIVKAEIEDTAASIGKALQPALLATLSAVEPVLKALGDFAGTSVGKVVTDIVVGLAAIAVTAGGAQKAVRLTSDTISAFRTVLDWYKLKIGANTLALDAETVALRANGAAQLQNAGAAQTAAGARGISGAATAGGWAGRATTMGSGMEALLAGLRTNTSAATVAVGGLGNEATLAGFKLAGLGPQIGILAAAMVAAYLVMQDIKVGMEAGQQIGKAQEGYKAAAQTRGEKDIEKAAVTLSDRFWGAFTLGGKNAQDIANVRAENERFATQGAWTPAQARAALGTGETPRQKAIREQREAAGMTSPATPGAAMPATGGATVSTAATKKGDKKKDAAAAELDMGTKKAGTRTRIGATAAAELGTQRVQVDVYLHGTDTVTDALAKSAEIRSSVKAAVSEGLVQANRA